MPEPLAAPGTCARIERLLRRRHGGGFVAASFEWKFRRQYPIGTYILDFYCNALRLAIELDGVGHVPSRDSFRTSVLQRYGIEVIRLSNEDIIGNPDGAWEHIAHVIAVRAGFVRQKNAFNPLHGDNDQ